MEVGELEKNVKNIVPERYELVLKLIDINSISFEDFQGKSILEWCLKDCSYDKICGFCPNPNNDFYKNGEKEIKNFKKGLAVIIKVPPEEFAGDNVLEKGTVVESQYVLNQILLKLKKKIEKNHKVLLLGGGPCKLIYCSDKPCSLLAEGKCIYPDLAHPAIEAYGINVFKTIENLGQKIYWIDENTKSKDVPYGLRVGLILF